jgi:hypothetical protein
MPASEQAQVMLGYVIIGIYSTTVVILFAAAWYYGGGEKWD